MRGGYERSIKTRTIDEGENTFFMSRKTVFSSCLLLSVHHPHGARTLSFFFVFGWRHVVKKSWSARERAREETAKRGVCHILRQRNKTDAARIACVGLVAMFAWLRDQGGFDIYRFKKTTVITSAKKKKRGANHCPQSQKKKHKKQAQVPDGRGPNLQRQQFHRDKGHDSSSSALSTPTST